MMTMWVPILTYPRKPDGSLQVCLDPKVLNKVILWEYYMAATLDEIFHQQSGATDFFKLNAKHGFEYSPTQSQLPLSHIQFPKKEIQIPLHAIWAQNESQDIFQMCMDWII